MEQSFPLQTSGHRQIPGRRGTQFIVVLFALFTHLSAFVHHHEELSLGQGSSESRACSRSVAA